MKGVRVVALVAPVLTAACEHGLPPTLVVGDGKGDDSRAGIRFTVAIDGAAGFAREVNPAAARADRRWFDERIDLTPRKDRTIDVTFGVAATGSGDVAGSAGWSRIRVVRETTVPRQEVAPRTARWKLVETPALAPRERFDSSVDPGERDDRAAIAPELAEMTAALARWRDATQTATANAVAPGVPERLRALGDTQ